MSPAPALLLDDGPLPQSWAHTSLVHLPIALQRGRLQLYKQTNTLTSHTHQPRPHTLVTVEDLSPCFCLSLSAGLRGGMPVAVPARFTLVSMAAVMGEGGLGMEQAEVGMDKMSS